MKYFNTQFFKFLDGLKKNNNREWFEKNRDLYEKEVKHPLKQLVVDLTLKLSKDYPDLNQNPSKSIFRINRDIRFSKDKSPYKTNVAAVFSRTGTKDDIYPGFYMHFGADECVAGGGKYMVSKEELEKIRQEIFYNHDKFAKLLNQKAFKEVYGSLHGEKNKVLSSDYKEFAKKQPIIANKQFWYSSELSRKEIMGDNLDSILLKKFKAGAYINRFLLEAIS